MKDLIDFVFEALEVLLGALSVYAVLAIVVAWTVVFPIVSGLVGGFAAGIIVFVINWLAYVTVCCKYYAENNAC